MQVSDEPIVTIDHLRSLGLCAKGARDAAVALYGIEGWKRFVREGVPARLLADSQHPDIQAAVALAKREFEENN